MPTPRKDLRLALDRVSFVADDIRLYLDTHTEDAAAQEFYQQAVTRRNQILQEYTYYYEPIRPDVMYYDAHWKWSDDPWPWEGDA